MCSFRPLAIALAPLVIRDLPPSIASDGARHTWPSYHRTLEHVVVDYRPHTDLVGTRASVTCVHGTDDHTAPLSALRHLANEVAVRGKAVDVRAVPGDHHVVVRRPAQVAAVLSELLVNRT
jgi:hypothetical protein